MNTFAHGQDTRHKSNTLSAWGVVNNFTVKRNTINCIRINIYIYIYIQITIFATLRERQSSPISLFCFKNKLGESIIIFLKGLGFKKTKYKINIHTYSARCVCAQNSC